MQPPGSGPHGPGTSADEVSLVPAKGWHVTHSFYSFDRSRLAGLDAVTRAEGIRQFAAALDPAAAGAPVRLQSWNHRLPIERKAEA